MDSLSLTTGNSIVISKKEFEKHDFIGIEEKIIKTGKLINKAEIAIEKVDFEKIIKKAKALDKRIVKENPWYLLTVSLLFDSALEEICTLGGILRM